jgi:hypothetical protein
MLWGHRLENSDHSRRLTPASTSRVGIEKRAHYDLDEEK